MAYTPKKIESVLRRHGYKLTPQRRSVVEVISGSHEHLTPAAIHERVCREHPGLGLVTVYRTLEILAGLGLVCELHTGENRSYLMRRPAEHHHHLICSDCGTVLDFTGCDLSELEERLARDTEFSIDSHLLEFTGQCPSCRRGKGRG